MPGGRRVWHAIAVSGARNPVRDPERLRSAHARTRVLEAALAQGQERGEPTGDRSADQPASMVEGLMLRVGIEWGAGFHAQRPLPDAMGEALEFFMRAARSNTRNSK